MGVVIQVLANNYTSNGVSVIPVVGAQIGGQAVGYCNNARQAYVLQSTTTNSSGWASLLDGQFGLYNLQITYDPTLIFNVSIVTQPTSVTYVVFNISTGNLTTHFCEYNVHCATTQITTTTTTSGSPAPTSSSTATSINITFQDGLNPPINLVLIMNENSSLQVSLEYYYYNDSATGSFNFTDWQSFVQISGVAQSGSFNASADFSVSSSMGPTQLGGPNNEGEGTSVVYTITPRQGVNGAYGFNLGWLFPSMQACGIDFEVVVGNGSPNNGLFGSCTTALSNQYPVNSQGFVSGFLLAEIVSIKSS